MHKILKIASLTILYNIVNSKETNVEGRNIDELEKENEDLLRQIDAAVKDSLDSLKQANDTRAVNIGMEMMRNITKMLNITGITDDNNKLDGEMGRWNNKTDSRRANDKRAKIRLTLEELQSLFDEEGTRHEKQSMDPARVEKMRNTIDHWLEQKKQERERIKHYEEKRKSEQSGGYEKCPRFGVGKKTVKKGGKWRKANYPCCRKCCKNSYMGCL